MIIAVMDRKYVNNKKTDDTYDDSIDLSNFEESLLLDDNNSLNDETIFNKMNVDFDYNKLNIELNFEEEDIDIQKDKKRYESDDFEENDLDWNSVFSSTNENLNLGSNNFNRIYNSTADDDYICSSSFENDTQNTSNMKNANLNNNNICKTSFEKECLVWAGGVPESPSEGSKLYRAFYNRLKSSLFLRLNELYGVYTSAQIEFTILFLLFFKSNMEALGLICLGF